VLQEGSGEDGGEEGAGAADVVVQVALGVAAAVLRG